MEVRRIMQKHGKNIWLYSHTLVLCIAMALPVFAQRGIKKYEINKGNMQVVLSKSLKEKELDDFIKQYNLQDLSLKKLMKNNFQDSVRNRGWKITVNNSELLVITKPFLSANNLNDAADWLKLTGMDIFVKDGNSAPVNTQAFGSNSFRSKHSFAIHDSIVTFILRNSKNAKRVFLAGDFTNWQANALDMVHTDSGWIVAVKLQPGKYLYKFIADGNWMTDPDNTNAENDGEGNTNSVYYFTNTSFRLEGFAKARKVYVAGSFNNWDDNVLRLNKTATGWELPVYLNKGTYTYRYIVDGKWMEDPGNTNHFPNEFDQFNSVINIGKPTLFKLPGHENAKKVILAGSFNQWRNFELVMTKTAAGWQFPYVLGPGNYEYKFYVDGEWLDAAGNKTREDAPGTVFVNEPNYTFHLKGHTDAKNIFLAGDFNNWSPNAYGMKKEGDGWVLKVHLAAGKHLYKFVIDGNWIRDTANGLWETDDGGNDNSVLWVK